MSDVATPEIAGPLVVHSPADLLGLVGQQLGPTGWLVIDQNRIDLFAEATNDRQWIHVDIDKARQGPFGATIAHGFLTLALVNHFLPELIEVRGAVMGVNVGAERLRFLAPVRASKSIRATGEIVASKDVGGGVQSNVRVTIEIEGEEKPACVVETINRYYFERNK